MTGKDLFDGMEWIGADLIARAEQEQVRRRPWGAVLATAAMLALVLGLSGLHVLRQSGSPADAVPQPVPTLLEQTWQNSENWRTLEGPFSLRVPPELEGAVELLPVSTRYPFRLVDPLAAQADPEGQGLVWELGAIPLAEFVGETGSAPADFSVPLYGDSDFLLGWDREQVYLLYLPPFPEWLVEPEQVQSYNRTRYLGYGILRELLDRCALTPGAFWEEEYLQPLFSLPLDPGVYPTAPRELRDYAARIPNLALYVREEPENALSWEDLLACRLVHCDLSQAVADLSVFQDVSPLTYLPLTEGRSPAEAFPESLRPAAEALDICFALLRDHPQLPQLCQETRWSLVKGEAAWLLYVGDVQILAQNFS